MAIERTGEAKEHFELGMKYIQPGADYSRVKAINEFTEVIKLLPNDDESYYQRGYVYEDSAEVAIPDYDKAISLNPNVANYYARRGWSYILKMKQPGKGILDLDKAISLDPANADFYQNRSLAYALMGEKQKAIADLEKAVELNPDNASSFYSTFANWIRSATGDRNEAAVYYKKAVERNAGYSWAIDNAKENLEEIENSPPLFSPSDTANQLFVKGKELFNQKDEENAIDLFTLAINRGCTYKNFAYFYRGLCHYGYSGDFHQAVNDFTKALEMGIPDNQKDFIYSTRGTAYCYIARFAYHIVNDKEPEESEYHSLQNIGPAIADLKKAADMGDKGSLETLASWGVQYTPGSGSLVPEGDAPTPITSFSIRGDSGIGKMSPDNPYHASEDYDMFNKTAKFLTKANDLYLNSGGQFNLDERLNAAKVNAEMTDFLSANKWKKCVNRIKSESSKFNEGFEILEHELPQKAAIAADIYSLCSSHILSNSVNDTANALSLCNKALEYAYLSAKYCAIFEAHKFGDESPSLSMDIPLMYLAGIYQRRGDVYKSMGETGKANADYQCAVNLRNPQYLSELRDKGNNYVATIATLGAQGDAEYKSGHRDIADYLWKRAQDMGGMSKADALAAVKKTIKDTNPDGHLGKSSRGSGGKKSSHRDKNQGVLIVLSVLLGYLGVDRFYIGRWGLGILKIITLPFGVGIIWWLIDIVLAITGKMEDSDCYDVDSTDNKAAPWIVLVILLAVMGFGASKMLPKFGVYTIGPITLGQPAAKAETVQTATTTQDVNLRAKPDGNATLIKTFDKGTTVTITGEAEGSWTPVEHGGDKGWVSSEYLSETTTAAKTMQ